MRIKVLNSFMHNGTLILPDKEIDVPEALGIELIVLKAAVKVQGGASTRKLDGNDMHIPEDLDAHVVATTERMVTPTKRTAKDKEKDKKE